MSGMKEFSEVYAAKEKRVKAIADLLATDPDSDIVSADYVHAGASEYVRIAYKGGASAYINVTIDSVGAIHKEMVLEVYGPGAGGKVESLPSVLYVAGLFDGKEAGK